MRNVITIFTFIFGMIMKCDAQQQRESAVTKPFGYQVTINAKESYLQLAYQGVFNTIYQKMESFVFPDTTGIAEEVRQKLPQLEKWMVALMPKIAGMKIDVIGQTHLVFNSVYNQPVYQNELLQSQAKIKDILLSNAYDVVGMEGAGKIVITKDVLSSNNWGQRKRYGVTRETSLYSPEINFAPEDKFTRDAIYALVQIPAFKSKVIGTEDSTIHYFQGLTLGSGDPDCNQFNCFNQPLSTLRSYIAFFRVAEEMINTGKKSGVVVIGSAHLRDFVFLARSLGANMDFYYTSAGDFFQNVGGMR